MIRLKENIVIVDRIKLQRRRSSVILQIKCPDTLEFFTLISCYYARPSYIENYIFIRGYCQSKNILEMYKSGAPGKGTSYQ